MQCLRQLGLPEYVIESHAVASYILQPTLSDPNGRSGAFVMCAEVAEGVLTCRVRVLGIDRVDELIAREWEPLETCDDKALKVDRQVGRLVEARARRESRAAAEARGTWIMAELDLMRREQSSPGRPLLSVWCSLSSWLPDLQLLDGVKASVGPWVLRRISSIREAGKVLGV